MQRFKNTTRSCLTTQILGLFDIFVILLVIFQAIYDWSTYPMDWIDGAFASMSSWVNNVFPSGPLTDLLAEGIIPGLGGIVIFIPQIAFLFLFIAIFRRKWLHEPGGIPYGSYHETFWFEW